MTFHEWSKTVDLGGQYNVANAAWDAALKYGAQKTPTNTTNTAIPIPVIVNVLGKYHCGSRVEQMISEMEQQ